MDSIKRSQEGDHDEFKLCAFSPIDLIEKLGHATDANCKTNTNIKCKWLLGLMGAVAQHIIKFKKWQHKMNLITIYVIWLWGQEGKKLGDRENGCQNKHTFDHLHTSD